MDRELAERFDRVSKDIEECLDSINQCVAWYLPWQDGGNGNINRPEDLFAAVYWARIHADEWCEFFDKTASALVVSDAAPASAIAEYRLMHLPDATVQGLESLELNDPLATAEPLIAESAHSAVAAAIYRIDRWLWGHSSPTKRCKPDAALSCVSQQLQLIADNCSRITWNETELSRILTSSLLKKLKKLSPRPARRPPPRKAGLLNCRRGER